MFLLPILLSKKFSPVVTPGQAVQKGTVLATSLGASEYVINIAHALGVTIRKAKSSVKKQAGAQVAIGELLAEKPGLFAGERIVSQVAGIIKIYKPDTGELIIQTFPENFSIAQKELVSPIDGIITVCDTEKIVIQTATPVIVATHGFGGFHEGELHVLTADAGSEVAYYAIDASMRGKVIAGGIFGRDSLIKAVGMNAGGILTTQISDEDLVYMQKKYSLPVLIVQKEDFSHIHAKHGQRIYLDGLSKSIVV